MRTVRIGDVAEVRPGYAVKGRVEPEPDGPYQLIQGKHLNPGEPYSYRPEDALRITPARKADPYLVHPGDLLIASRGTSNYAVELRDVPPMTIAPATFYILRRRADLLAADYVPAYLAWVLGQPPLQAQIAQIRTGAATPILQREDFNAITIPLPPLAEQERIARIAALMQRERLLLRRLEQATNRYHAAIGSTLLAGRLRMAPAEENR